jgi:hypothetical protein
VNRFLAKFLEEDLGNISNFLATVNTFKGAPYEVFFTRSQASTLIAKRLRDTYLFRYDYPTRIKQLRGIFLTNFNDIYLPRELLPPIILEKRPPNNEVVLNLLTNLDNFSDCYKRLLREWGDWELSFEAGQRYLRHKIQNRQGIQNLVSEFDDFLLDLAKECPDPTHPLYQKEQQFIALLAREAAFVIHLRSTQIRDKVLIDFEPLAKLNACKVK